MAGTPRADCGERVLRRGYRLAPERLEDSMSDIGSLFSVSGRTAVVTGGATGIGKSICRALLRGGAKVWIVNRRAEKGQEAADELRQHGEIESVAADITTDTGIASILQAVGAKSDGIDILVNNAGMTASHPLGSFPAEDWDSVLSVNLKAPFMLTQAALPLLRANATPRRPSHVINVGSCAAIVTTTKGSFSYFASKAAVHHLTRVLAGALVGDHIHVNTIAPSYFRSEIIDAIAPTEEDRARILQPVPMARFGDDDDVAGAILYLATSSYVTGHILPLDGGFLLK
jgi:NAD(P)-dependent dehydrogenase (short-subunit alcohol dehydrogenase family)